jgi:hypothetical protein
MMASSGGHAGRCLAQLSVVVPVDVAASTIRPLIWKGFLDNLPRREIFRPQVSCYARLAGRPGAASRRARGDRHHRAVPYPVGHIAGRARRA